MKTKMFVTVLTLAVFTAGSFEVKAQEKTRQKDAQQEFRTDEFKVAGNCGMCEKRIEGSLTGVEGVKSADWDTDTKMITVTYDDQVINLDGICMKIADVGHDTPWYTAKDEVYNNLHGCCQYARQESKD